MYMYIEDFVQWFYQRASGLGTVYSIRTWRSTQLKIIIFHTVPLRKPLQRVNPSVQRCYFPVAKSLQRTGSWVESWKNSKACIPQWHVNYVGWEYFCKLQNVYAIDDWLIKLLGELRACVICGARLIR